MKSAEISQNNLHRKKLKVGKISVIIIYNIWTYHRERKT